jgi:membrane protease YdiL (CAAX protease family)
MAIAVPIPAGSAPVTAHVHVPERRAKRRARGAPPPLPLALRYLRESQDFATGFLFIVPLIVGYEAGLVLLRSDVINWAHGIIRLVFHLFGPAEPVLFAGLAACLVVLALRRAERLRIDAELYGLMLAESVVYACGLGLVCSFAARRLVLMGTPEAGRTLAHDLVLSVGAGVYEEVLFRVALLGALYYLLKRWGRVKPGLAAFVSIVLSSLAFAACHHIGPYGDPLEPARLAYRFGMGVLFAAIYIYRGLGIVVYTHALYDIFVSLSR